MAHPAPPPWRCKKYLSENPRPLVPVALYNMREALYTQRKLAKEKCMGTLALPGYISLNAHERRKMYRTAMREVHFNRIRAGTHWEVWAEDLGYIKGADGNWDWRGTCKKCGIGYHRAAQCEAKIRHLEATGECEITNRLLGCKNVGHPPYRFGDLRRCRLCGP